MSFGRAFCVVLAANVVTVQAKAETLADALVGAYNHSGLIEQNRALLRAADEDVAAAVSVLKPVLSWSAEVTQNFGSSRFSNNAAFRSENDDLTVGANLTAELLLYDFGASKFRVEAAKETVLATREVLRNVEQQVMLAAVGAFFGVLEASEFVALRQNNLRLLTQELRAAKDRFEVGEVTRTDVALAEAQLAQARSGLAGAEGDLLRAIEEYRNAVGRTPGNLRQPPRLPNVGSDVRTAKALAVRQHPRILAAQFRTKAADLLVNASTADLNPRISLQGVARVSRDLNSAARGNTASVGVIANQTIYQGGRLSSGIRANMAQRDAQRAELHVVKHDLQQAVGDAYATLLSARAQLEASEGQIRAARIAFQGVREEATLGARTTLDVLDAEQSLLDAETNQVTARANLYVAAYTVLASTGRLTAKDLRLPVQLYDPAAYYNLVKDGPAKKSEQGKKLDRVLRALQKD
ncbi:TolC family outer membrane protein [Sulfitobacter sp. JB4-11]|uniref:TolC family outer membrane protein n=1 Tax=Sulfitobacter rhodophyticola TaxID=3238304 RepID=UPI003D81774F